MQSILGLCLLTDGRDEMTLDIVIHRLDTLEETYRMRRRYKFDSPITTVRCVICIRDCFFPVAGAYQVSLMIEYETVAQRKITILQKESEL